MQNICIAFFQDKYFSEAEKLLKDNPDIFSESDCKEYREDLLVYLQEIPHNDREKRIMVLLLEGIPVGLVMITKVRDSESYFRIKWLVIKSTEHNKGFGTKLIQYAFHEIKKLGGKHVYVETSNEQHNKFAKHFYQKLGLSKVGILPNYYPRPLKGKRQSEDYILYYKNLYI